VSKLPCGLNGGKSMEPSREGKREILTLCQHYTSWKWRETMSEIKG